MKKYKGAFLLLLGLAGMAGANSTGDGWFTSSALIGIGAAMTLVNYGREKRHEKKQNRADSGNAGSSPVD